jgi:hypothetical protein
MLFLYALRPLTALEDRKLAFSRIIPRFAFGYVLADETDSHVISQMIPINSTVERGVALNQFVYVGTRDSLVVVGVVVAVVGGQLHVTRHTDRPTAQSYHHSCNYSTDAWTLSTITAQHIYAWHG